MIYLFAHPELDGIGHILCLNTIDTLYLIDSITASHCFMRSYFDDIPVGWNWITNIRWWIDRNLYYYFCITFGLINHFPSNLWLVARPKWCSFCWYQNVHSLSSVPFPLWPHWLSVFVLIRRGYIQRTLYYLFLNELNLLNNDFWIKIKSDSGCLYPT